MLFRSAHHSCRTQFFGLLGHHGWSLGSESGASQTSSESSAYDWETQGQAFALPWRFPYTPLPQFPYLWKSSYENEVCNAVVDSQCYKSQLAVQMERWVSVL